MDHGRATMLQYQYLARNGKQPDTVVSNQPYVPAHTQGHLTAPNGPPSGPTHAQAGPAGPQKPLSPSQTQHLTPSSEGMHFQINISLDFFLL
jgi:hypothetical protein